MCRCLSNIDIAGWLVSSLVEGSASHLPLLVDSVGGRAGPGGGGEDTAVQGEGTEEGRARRCLHRWESRVGGMEEEVYSWE